MNNYTLKQIELEAKLHQAIQEDQFIVHYQPLVDIKTQKPLGVEALVRWQNQDGNIIPPLDFIPLAEEIGLIDAIGQIVLRKACLQGFAWEELGFKDFKVSVNISAHQFRYGKLVDVVKDILYESGMNPKNLELELTESVLINNSDFVSSTLSELSNFGVTMSIDDFGTGYSSFNYVKRFPISKVKIDRSFIINCVDNPEDHAIVTAIAVMCHTLKYIVLAEGIETREQFEFLSSIGCDQVQGFYFSKPLSAEDCTKFLLEHK